MMLMQGSKAKKIYVKQGSPEWHELRRQHVCASDSAPILGISPWRTRGELLDEKRGLIPPQPINSAMERGMMLEDKARKCAEKMLDMLFLPEVYVSNEYPFMCASYDGISFDYKSILEIKCTNKKNHALAKAGQIPDYYMPQVQHQIAVYGAEECLYFSFDGEKGIVVNVPRDDTFIMRMIIEEQQFYQEMTK